MKAQDRQPPTANPVGSGFPIALLALGLPTLALVASAAIVGESLRPCAWLDRLIDRSGCTGRIAIVHPDDRSFVIADLAYAPDGQTLLVAGGSSNDAELRFYRVADGALVRRLPLETRPFQIAVIPGSAQLLTYDLDTLIAVYDLVSGQELRRFQVDGTLADTFDPTFSTDRRYMSLRYELVDLDGEASIPDDQKIDLYRRYPELLRRQEGLALTGVATPDGRLRTVLVAWPRENSPDAIAGRRYDLALVDAATTDPEVEVIEALSPGAIRMAGPISDLTDLSFAPAGALLLARYNDGSTRGADDQSANISLDWLRVWRVSDGTTVLATTLEDTFMRAVPVWSPDGTTIAVPSGRPEAILLYRVR